MAEARIMNRGRYTVVLLLLLLSQAVVAPAQTGSAIDNSSNAVFTVTSLNSGELLHVESGAFRIDTEKRVTLMGYWGAVTISHGQAQLTVENGSIEVLAVKGDALVFKSPDPETSPVVLPAGEKLSWFVEPRQAILNSLGQCE